MNPPTGSTQHYWRRSSARLVKCCMPLRTWATVGANGCGRTGHCRRVHHVFPAGFAGQLPAQACQTGWPDVRPQELHGAGARRDDVANPALPADTGFDQRHRGVATWLAPSALGVDQAAVWGVLPLALNFIPSIGSIVITGASALAGFVQFGSFDMALVLAGTSIALHTVSGNLLTPWLAVRISRIIPVIVFVGVLLFGCWAIARLHNPRGSTIPPLPSASPSLNLSCCARTERLSGRSGPDLTFSRWAVRSGFDHESRIDQVQSAPTHSRVSGGA